MTKEQWMEVKVGDTLVDHRTKNRPERKVLEVSRRFVRRGCIGPGHWSTTLTVSGVKSDRPITIFQADDWLDGVGKRFTLKEWNNG